VSELGDCRELQADRRRSRANALKHGLSARILIGEIGEDRGRLNQLIALLAPDCDNKELWQAAREVAEAWVYSEKVSRAREDDITHATGSTRNFGSRDGSSDRVSGGKISRSSRDRLKRYERQAVNRLERALEQLQLLLCR
jgi:hypothetical protein